MKPTPISTYQFYKQMMSTLASKTNPCSFSTTQTKGSKVCWAEVWARPLSTERSVLFGLMKKGGKVYSLVSVVKTPTDFIFSSPLLMAVTSTKRNGKSPSAPVTRKQSLSAGGSTPITPSPPKTLGTKPTGKPTPTSAQNKPLEPQYTKTITT